MTMNHRAHRAVDDDRSPALPAILASPRPSIRDRSARQAGPRNPHAPSVPGPRQPRFLSVAGAAEVLGMSQVTLYRAIQARQFPAIKIRGRFVIPARALDAIEDAALTTGTLVDPSHWAQDHDDE